MQIQLSNEDSTPRYLQIVRQVKYFVATNRLQAGDELPAIRTLAEQLVINPNTVAKAYRELEHEGIVVKRQTTGTFVSEKGSQLAIKERKRILNEMIDRLLVEATHLDYDFDTLLEMIQQRQTAFRRPSEKPS